MNNKQNSFILGRVKINGPIASEKQCSIFVDLAGLLGYEYSSEAFSKLKEEWKGQGKKGKLDIDAESDYVSILTSRNAVVDLAVLINELADTKLDEKQVLEARKKVKLWKQPEPFPWKIGDIFSVELQDNLYVYGQVLDKTSYNEPTCVLFSLKSEVPVVDIKELLKSKPISILHVYGDHLDDQSWTVIGNTKPVLKPGSGPCGVKGEVGSKDWDGFEILAKAWYGLAPWNDFYKDDYLDQYLLKGVKRPSEVIFIERE